MRILFALLFAACSLSVFDAKAQETGGNHDEKNSAQAKRGSLFSAGFSPVFFALIKIHIYF